MAFTHDEYRLREAKLLATVKAMASDPTDPRSVCWVRLGMWTNSENWSPPKLPFPSSVSGELRDQSVPEALIYQRAPKTFYQSLKSLRLASFQGMAVRTPLSVPPIPFYGTRTLANLRPLAPGLAMASMVLAQVSPAFGREAFPLL